MHPIELQAIVGDFRARVDEIVRSLAEARPPAPVDWRPAAAPPPAAVPFEPLGDAYLVVLETSPFYMSVRERRAVPGRRHVAVARLLHGRWFADGWNDNPAQDGSPRYRVTHWAPLPGLPPQPRIGGGEPPREAV
jgi:hypothetical protein